MRWQKGDYFQIPNKTALTSSNLDGMAQSVYLWLCAFANDDGECFPSQATLAKRTKLARQTVNVKIGELVQAGFIVRIAPKKSGGGCHYQLLDLRPPEETDEVPPITQQTAGDVDEIIELFAGVNPTHYRLKVNKTQRTAVYRMLEHLGKEKILEAMRLVNLYHAVRFAPSITTPSTLESKWGELMAFHAKQGSPSPPKTAQAIKRRPVNVNGMKSIKSLLESKS